MNEELLKIEKCLAQPWPQKVTVHPLAGDISDNRLPPSLVPKMKRKIADQIATTVTAPPKKRSPLLGRPQNHYDVPEELKATMTKEQLTEWRKQMRKERNRASAAASRLKTQLRVKELEGEVTKWKSNYEALHEKMIRLQNQVDLLSKSKTHFQVPQAATTVQNESPHEHYMVSPTISYLPSSSSLEQIDALSLLQGLSRPRVVPSTDATSLLPSQSSCSEGQTTVEDKVMPSTDISKKHLITISRQA